MRGLPKPKGRYHTVDMINTAPADPPVANGKGALIWAVLEHPDVGDILVHLENVSTVDKPDKTREVWFKIRPTHTLFTGQKTWNPADLQDVQVVAAWSDFLRITKRRNNLVVNDPRDECVLARVTWHGAGDQYGVLRAQDVVYDDPDPRGS